MTYRLWEVIAQLLQRSKDERRTPEDRVNYIIDAFSLIDGIAADPETSPEERAIATDIREDISRRAHLLTDDVKAGLKKLAADERTPTEIRQEIRVRLAQLEQQLKERGPDHTRWLQ